MPGAQCTRSRACRIGSTRVSHHGRTGTPGIPARDGVTAYFVLSLVTGLFCHHHPRRNHLRQLDASVGASGPHDFAVRVSALVSRATRVHRIPNPTSVTIAKRPSVLGRDGERGEVIWVRREREYFCEGGWTVDSVQQITLSAQGGLLRPGDELLAAESRCHSHRAAKTCLRGDQCLNVHRYHPQRHLP
jgi:hypothetical protein